MKSKVRIKNVEPIKGNAMMYFKKQFEGLDINVFLNKCNECGKIFALFSKAFVHARKCSPELKK